MGQDGIPDGASVKHHVPQYDSQDKPGKEREELKVKGAEK